MIISINNFPNNSGVYKITSPSGKIYIGEAINLKERCSFYLNPNSVKKQRAIYNSLIKYSVEKHIIEIVEFCEINKLLERERYWQEFYNSVNDGLNCYLTKTNEKKKVLSEETKKLMSDKSKGERNHFFGKKHTDRSLLKISKASKGENNVNYGSKLKNDDWLLKQSKSNSKTPIKVINIETNEETIFLNSKLAAKFLECSPSTIRMAKTEKYKINKKYIIKNHDGYYSN
jgi:hypothetical protein